jgi:hypothetical protein
MGLVLELALVLGQQLVSLRLASASVLALVRLVRLALQLQAFPPIQPWPVRVAVLALAQQVFDSWQPVAKGNSRGLAVDATSS